MHTILAHQQHVVVDLTVDDVDSGGSEAVCARPGKKVKHTHEEEASAGNAISSREVVHLLQYAAAHDQKKRLWKARHATLQARVLALEAELAAAGAAAIAKKAREAKDIGTTLLAPLPLSWTTPVPLTACTMSELKQGSSEYNSALGKLDAWFQKAVVHIHRVENPWLWQRYVTCRRRIAAEVMQLRDTGQGLKAALVHDALPGTGGEKDASAALHDGVDSAHELWLLHGSSNTAPSTICRGTGIDCRYSQPGFFGRAAYFTSDVRYIIENRMHHCADSHHGQVILAQVSAGFIKEEVSPLVRHDGYMHPPIPYHSVKGAVVYKPTGEPKYAALATYEVHQSYPTYIVTFDMAKT